jgi:hypothetical protein
MVCAPHSRRLTILGCLFVVIVAVGIALLWTFSLGERTHYGRHTNILAPGDHVVLAEDFRGTRADQVIRRTREKDYEWLGSAIDLFVDFFLDA